MKFNVIRSNGSVSFTFDTKYITDPLIIILIFPFAFLAVWSLAPPPFFYDIVLAMLVTIKLYRFWQRSRR